MADAPQDSLILTEVGPRDGLQNEKVIIPTAAKIQFIEALADAGLKRIEVTSFVHPGRVPAMADAEEVFAGLTPRDGVAYIALVPNQRGWDRAVAAGCRHAGIFTAASEAFNQANIGMGVEQSLSNFRELVPRMRDEGAWIRAYVSTVIACPYAGDIAPVEVRRVVEAIAELEVDEISLGDTIGVGTPGSFHALLDEVLDVIPPERVALHGHDTWGMAAANVMAALERGIRSFDASAGGLGGCPFAPGATGNAATEDVVYLLEGMGHSTGVDPLRVARAASAIGDHLDHPLPGRVHHAILSRDEGEATC